MTATTDATRPKKEGSLFWPPGKLRDPDGFVRRINAENAKLKEENATLKELVRALLATSPIEHDGRSMTRLRDQEAADAAEVDDEQDDGR